ncbi:MAG: hypothetical protein SGI97_09645, partial [candidate division Zixibacteria bacterium]|nr:hypothetical protein [candidate division Zixibacteria bacterium]
QQKTPMDFVADVRPRAPALLPRVIAKSPQATYSHTGQETPSRWLGYRRSKRTPNLVIAGPDS